MSTSTELITIDATAITDSHFSVSREQIKEEISKFHGLSCDGIDDKDGLEEVRKARIKCKNIRVAIENRRKELKAGALEYGRKVDSTAKELTSLVEPTEKRLKAIEDGIADQIEELKRQKLQSRIAQLEAVRANVASSWIESMSDDEFSELLAVKTEENAKRIEQERAEAEEKARKEAEEKAEREAEALRLSQERKAMEAEREALEKERRRIAEEAESKRIEQEKSMAAEREKIEAERLKLEEEQRKVREEQEAREAAELEARRKELEEEAARKERERLLELRPDREKLLSVVESIRKVEIPHVSEEAGVVFDAVRDAINRCAGEVFAIIDEMIPEARE